MPNPWTAKETKTALRLYSSGHTFSDIAKTLKRTRGEIAGKLYRERRNGTVGSRLGKDRPPPRESKNPKPQQAPSKERCPPKPRPQPIRMPKMTEKVERYSPLPMPYVAPPPPAGPPTCWELGPYDCRFPIGRREPDGYSTFCAQPVEPGTSWCPDHHRVVYTRRSA